MNKDEIKKALACYEKIDLDCHKCPYNIYGDNCCIQVRGDALDLITEQEQEIERLKVEIIKQDQAIIERNFELVELEDKIKQAKIDVLNELKEEYGFYSCYSWGNDVKSLNEIIDELLEV